MKNIILISVGLLLFSCSSGSFKTENGTLVNYFEEGNGQLPVDSLVGMFCIRYETEDGKVMMEADINNPLPLKIDPNNTAQQGELYAVLSKLRTGDSVGFELIASELFEKTFRAPMPDSIAPESKIKFQIAFIDQLSEAGYYDFMAKKAEKEGAKQMVIDNEILDAYMSENNIDPTKTSSGLRYVITEEGSGDKPENGQVVQVNYAGWILNGPYFDTSLESVAREQGLYQEGRPYQPFSFALGQGRVIKGWDEGIALLNVGGKATLYIPSPLGYGSRSAGSTIKANSILVFDVELVGIQ
jgi:FKBP-type peptidyl-prolyl cis-trans isomerase